MHGENLKLNKFTEMSLVRSTAEDMLRDQRFVFIFSERQNK